MILIQIAIALQMGHALMILILLTIIIQVIHTIALIATEAMDNVRESMLIAHVASQMISLSTLTKYINSIIALQYALRAPFLIGFTISVYLVTMDAQTVIQTELALAAILLIK